MASPPTDPEKVDVASSIGLGMSMVIKSLKMKFPRANNVTTSTLSDWLKPNSDTDVTILDCRPPEEYAVSHIENSIQIDWQAQDMEKLVNDIPSLSHTSEGKKKAVVCYCSIGYRSSALDQKLQDYFNSKDGITTPPVFNLEGSLFKWANEGRPMVDSTNQKTVFAHPFNALWGKLLNKELRKSSSQE